MRHQLDINICFVCFHQVPGSRREDEFRIFLEDHCEHPADAVTCGEYLMVSGGVSWITVKQSRTFASLYVSDGTSTWSKDGETRSQAIELNGHRRRIDVFGYGYQCCGLANDQVVCFSPCTSTGLDHLSEQKLSMLLVDPVCRSLIALGSNVTRFACCMLHSAPHMT
mmetsp:Transcript_47524/g.152672  ORF Transcript_47524/g.152672 Transcript_47524/m.152672 type:complete len:167 (+) Transcript_47524:688-1188(+)